MLTPLLNQISNFIHESVDFLFLKVTKTQNKQGLNVCVCPARHEAGHIFELSIYSFWICTYALNKIQVFASKQIEQVLNYRDGYLYPSGNGYPRET